MTTGEWRPIESAPKDGTWVWAYAPGVVIPVQKGKRTRKTRDRVFAAHWVSNPADGHGSRLSDHAKELREKHGGFWSGNPNGRRPVANLPTHWQPLPPPPKDKE